MRVLNEPEADRKAALSAEFWEVWQQGRVSCQDLTRHAGLVPDRPARSDDKASKRLGWPARLIAAEHCRTRWAVASWMHAAAPAWLWRDRSDALAPRVAPRMPVAPRCS